LVVTVHRLPGQHAFGPHAPRASCTLRVGPTIRVQGTPGRAPRTRNTNEYPRHMAACMAAVRGAHLQVPSQEMLIQSSLSSTVLCVIITTVPRLSGGSKVRLHELQTPRTSRVRAPKCHVPANFLQIPKIHTNVILCWHFALESVSSYCVPQYDPQVFRSLSRAAQSLPDFDKS
jgi:hypothetical protein